MAQPNMPYMNKYVINVVRDAHGNVILEIPTSECMVPGPDGSLTSYIINESQPLGCGLVYHSSMGQGPNPAVMLGVCAICGSPCSLNKGCNCLGCGRFLCPRHAVFCGDGRRRCERCSCFHSVKRGLRQIFFRLEEQD